MKSILELLSKYEKVVYGDLRPWLPENLDDSKYKEIIDSFLTVQEGLTIKQSVSIKIKNHPLLGYDIEDFEISVAEENRQIDLSKQEDIPYIFFNDNLTDKIQFYYLLIIPQRSILLKKISDYLIDENDGLDFSSSLNKLIVRLKQLLIDAYNKKETIENYSNGFILKILIDEIIQIIISITSLYKQNLKEGPLTEEDIYINVLKRDAPGSFKYVDLYNNMCDSIFNHPYFVPIEVIRETIDDCKLSLVKITNSKKIRYLTSEDTRNKIIDIISTLENLLFYRFFEDDKQNISKAELADENYIQRACESFKNRIEDEIRSLNNHVSIIEYLTKVNQRNRNILSADPIISDIGLKQSLPRLIKLYLDLLLEHYKKLDSTTPNNFKSSFVKIETNLSVNELAFLFKALLDEEIINLGDNHKTDLYRTVTSVFTTKGSEDLKPGSFKNNFNQTDHKTADNWLARFTRLMQYSKKIRDNNVS